MAAPSAAGVLGCLFTLLGLSGLLILARLWLRLQIQSQPLALSDGLLVIAWFSCLAQAVLVILMRNEDVLHPDINYTLFNWEADPAKVEHVRKEPKLANASPLKCEEIGDLVRVRCEMPGRRHEFDARDVASGEIVQ
ncbi:hypothetical protein CGCF415_v009498 [Colletotrichum fructicola]|nr:hypothetical protein CGCFRS4_v006969 [Colletotrichum fructicola]KAF4901948.1 hypothetical protein CGCF415_v009498 [Colletotrichum fructicola]KAF4934034.1 hypothetical protein CGCF245_v009039 [Colletotrichum fructicola]